MLRLRGCDHRENTRHKREDVTLALNNLKWKHPESMVTVGEMAHFIYMLFDHP